MKGRKLFIMEEDKNIADSIFKERRNEIHIQLEETESLINQCDEKNAIAYILNSIFFLFAILKVLLKN